MWNIIKAQNYQLKRDNLTVYGLLGIVVLMTISVISNVAETPFKEITGGGFIAMASIVHIVILMACPIWFACRIAGWDFMDKTVNYEIMSGHSRQEVYFGRWITAAIWCIAIAFVSIVLPTAFFTVMNGFGVSMDFSDMCMRYLLLLLPMLRVMSFCVCVAFLVRNGLLATIVTFFVTDGIVLLKEIMDEQGLNPLHNTFALSNMMWLIQEMNAKIGYVDGEDVMQYVTALDQTMIVQTVVTSCIMIVIYTGIGFLAYKRMDQN